ncbi:hypothetical protein B0T18DRAFT_87964 [Schizothecium vesticola]|uniref:Uncharacterized protein n=1 Tax=Schizothecium vesticola TaxID=314040 RepID=A0AA40F6V5_9PEZI|nr:hypothetical protein B0T18DRAFT_87964 [Schizothecium vesticola]
MGGRGHRDSGGAHSHSGAPRVLSSRQKGPAAFDVAAGRHKRPEGHGHAIYIVCCLLPVTQKAPVLPLRTPLHSTSRRLPPDSGDTSQVKEGLWREARAESEVGWMDGWGINAARMRGRPFLLLVDGVEVMEGWRTLWDGYHAASGGGRSDDWMAWLDRNNQMLRVVRGLVSQLASLPASGEGGWRGWRTT